MESAARVVVIGSSNTDMVVKVPRIPAPGETILGGDLTMVPGGKGANQAVAAARLGAKVTFVGCVGADTFGGRSLAGLADEGIDVSRCVTLDGVPSGVALIAVDDRGQNAIVVAPGANRRLRPEHLAPAEGAIAEADAVVLQCETPLETIADAVRIAKRYEKLVVLNPAPARTLPRGLVSLVDVLTPNETEARCLLDEGIASGDGTEENLVLPLLDAGVKLAVITLGARGLLFGFRLAGRTVVQRIEAFAVDAVDATAAGDCFTGALACALAERIRSGEPLWVIEGITRALRFASAAAALSVTRLGAQSSLPTRAEVEHFLLESGV